MCILFLWPLLAMLVLHNWPVAIVFFVMGVFSLIWRYFDSTTVLSGRKLKDGTIFPHRCYLTQLFVFLIDYGTLSKVKDTEMDHSKKYFLSTVGQDVINNQGGLHIFD